MVGSILTFTQQMEKTTAFENIYNSITFFEKKIFFIFNVFFMYLEFCDISFILRTLQHIV